MREKEKNHINRNLPELIDNTLVNTTIITRLIASNVFGNEDTARLDSIDNAREKSLEFYRLAMMKYNSFTHLKTALREANQSKAVAILERLDGENAYELAFQYLISPHLRSLQQQSRFPTTTSICSATPRTRGAQRSTVHLNVDPPVYHFTGRVKELNDLHLKLRNKPTTIVGLGGVGKTEIARRYIECYMELYDNVIWINGETEQTLAEGFRRLATDSLQLSILNVDGKEKKITSVVQEVYNFFVGKRTLFVFDNGMSHEVIKPFMPFFRDRSIRPFVLITSRCREWSFSVEILDLLEVPQMDKQEAIKLVNSCLHTQCDDDNRLIAKLVNRLHCYPLALMQATSDIRQKREHFRSTFSIDEYLELLNHDPEKLLGSEVAELTTYGRTTITTWNETIAKIAETKNIGRKAVWMLKIISYFMPDNIPTAMITSHTIHQLYAGSQNKITHLLSSALIFRPGRQMPSNSPVTISNNEKALYLLRKYSMIKTEPTTQTISVHRLVQEVTRINLKKHPRKEETILKNALKLLATDSNPNNRLHVFSVFKFCVPYESLIVEFSRFQQRMLNMYEADQASDNDSDTDEVINQICQHPDYEPQEEHFARASIFRRSFP